MYLCGLKLHRTDCPLFFPTHKMAPPRYSRCAAAPMMKTHPHRSASVFSAKRAIIH